MAVPHEPSYAQDFAPVQLIFIHSFSHFYLFLFSLSKRLISFRRGSRAFLLAVNFCWQRARAHAIRFLDA